MATYPASEEIGTTGQDDNNFEKDDYQRSYSSAGFYGETFVRHTELHAMQEAQAKGFEVALMKHQTKIEETISTFNTKADEIKTELGFHKFRTLLLIFGTAATCVATLVGFVFLNKELTVTAFGSGFETRATVVENAIDSEQTLNSLKNRIEKNQLNTEELSEYTNDLTELVRAIVELERKRAGVSTDE